MSEEVANNQVTKEGQPPNQPAPRQPVNGSDKKILAGILGILLGGLGIHKFVLGYTKEGIIMLLISVLTCGFGAIVIDGAAPTITSIQVAAAFDSAMPTAYTRGQTIQFEVTFSAAVIILNGFDNAASPVLLLDVGALTREATYVSGNSTSVFTFSYTVQVGDIATNLGFARSGETF